MGSYKSGVPSYWRKNMGQQFARRTAAKEQLKRKNENNREATAQVVSYCAMIAADDIMGLGKKGVEALTNSMEAAADMWEKARDKNGMMAARKKLEADTAHLIPKDLVFPAGKKNDPKMRMESWRMMAAQRRDAADMTARLCALGMERQGYEIEMIHEIMKETRNNFEQFLGWAEDGEEVAYEMLRRVAEQMLKEEVRVEQVGSPSPIFAEEF